MTLGPSEKLELERKLRRYRELLREFPDGPTNETIRDLIEELEKELRKNMGVASDASRYLPLPNIAHLVSRHSHGPAVCDGEVRPPQLAAKVGGLEWFDLVKAYESKSASYTMR